jgi:hypothetical protein
MRVRFGLAVALALTATTLFTFAAGTASATPVFSLRVEAPGSTLDPGTHYAIPSTTSAPRGALNPSGTCVGAQGRLPLASGTAIGLITAASAANPALAPLFVAEDAFGKRVCRIGDFAETDTPFSGWLFHFNHRFSTVGAELVAVSKGDDVLWYFADFGSGANTGDELLLSAPVRAKPGTVPVSVQAIDFDGNVKPAPDGTVVVGGSAAATTVGGVATVAVEAGDTTLRAVGPGATPTEIPSNPLSLCVAADVGDCPAARGRRIVGTNDGDSLKGTPGRDRIKSRGGPDKIRVVGGSADVVNCGRGKDTVIADQRDRLRRCEKVGGPAKKGGKKK